MHKQALQAAIKDQREILDIAKREHAHAMSAIAADPLDKQLRYEASRALAAKQQAEEEFTVLKDALDQTLNYELSPEGVAKKEQAGKHLKNVESLLDLRHKAAQELDAKVAELGDAARKYAQVCESVQTELSGFWRSVYPKDYNALLSSLTTVASLRGVVANAVAAQLDLALEPLPMTAHMAFNYSRPAHSYPKAADAAQNDGRTLLSRAQEVANIEGVSA